MQGVSTLGPNPSVRSAELTDEAPSNRHLAEVWGDVVDLRHLAAAVAIGAVISLTTYLIASRIFASFVTVPELGRAYGMLAGLAGCVTAGVICARLFPAKREILESADDPAWRAQALEQLISETGAIGTPGDLPPAAAAEMKELGLWDLFAAHDRTEARQPAAGEPRLVAQGG